MSVETKTAVRPSRMTGHQHIEMVERFAAHNYHLRTKIVTFFCFSSTIKTSYKRRTLYKINSLLIT